MRRALLVLVAACGSEQTEQAPRPDPKPLPAPAITTRLVGCANALNAPQLVAENPGATTGVATHPQPAPRVLVAPPRVAGDLDPRTVHAILRRHATRFQYCFEKQLLVEPTLPGGAIDASFAVQPSGYVASPQADGVHPEVARCVVSALKSVAFPAPIDQNQVQVAVAIEVVHKPSNLPRPRPEPRVSRGWTPFAADGTASDDVAKPLVDATTAILQARIAGVEGCFDDMRGALRAVIGFDMWGRIKSLRVGGLGEAAIERCVETALGNFTVVAPAAPVEVACDFTRGGDAPLRVTPDAGYTVIEAARTHVHHGGFSREVKSRGERPSAALLAQVPVLIIAEPDAAGHVLEFALAWASAGTTLVAVKAAGGAPVFVGMGGGVDRRLAPDRRVVQLRTDNGRLHACIPGETLDASAPILDPRAMDRVLEAAALACRRSACESTIVVGTSGELVAKDLVATTSAARRAGFHQLAIGGAACER